MAFNIFTYKVAINQALIRFFALSNNLLFAEIQPTSTPPANEFIDSNNSIQNIQRSSRSKWMQEVTIPSTKIKQNKIVSKELPNSFTLETILLKINGKEFLIKKELIFKIYETMKKLKDPGLGQFKIIGSNPNLISRKIFITKIKELQSP